MASSSARNPTRDHVLLKRQTGIADLTTIDWTNGELSAFDTSYIASVARNNIFSIGIGTETEIGLTPDRYPIRVIVANGSPRSVDPVTCFKYWKIVSADGNALPFTRRPAFDHQALANYLSVMPTLPEILKDLSDIQTTNVFAIKEPWTATINTFRTIVTQAVLTEENRVIIANGMNTIINNARTERAVLYLPLGDAAYLTSAKCGSVMVNPAAAAGVAVVPEEMKKMAEFLGTACANYKKLSTTYNDLKAGWWTLGAYTTATMFKLGLYEAYESKEYHEITVNYSEDKRFVITAVNFKEGHAPPAELQVGQVLDCSAAKVSKTQTIISGAMCYLAGLNHYTFNHTTGGTRVTGALLSLLAMYGFITSATTAAEEEKQVKLLYETLHPVNKRGVANIWFDNSKVLCWGRDPSAPIMPELQIDAFLRTRTKPTPAGAHKAYLAGNVLARILRQGFGPLLPWAGSLTHIVDSIGTILDLGAGAHIGSNYYTGTSSVTQGSTLDQYMPDLAQFVHTMSPGDTLTMSPHLSHETATRAVPGWTNILKQIRGKSLTNMSTEMIGEFLKRTGAVNLEFDPDNRDTWQAAIDESKAASTRISNILIR